LAHESSVDANEDADDVFALSMMLPTIDPVTWKLETERVAELLLAGRQTLAIGVASWGDNFLRLRKLSNVWLNNAEAVDKNVAPEITATVLSDLVAGIQRDVDSDHKSILRGEGYVNNDERLRVLCGEYAIYKKV
jgi:hypothetical protein